MRYWLVSLLAVAACGDPAPPHFYPCDLCDSNVDTFFAVYCDPLAQTSCGAGKKCTWIVAPDVGEAPPAVGCVPDGAAALGSACALNGSGYDDCAKGLYCAGGVCDAICSFDAPACGSGTACVRNPWLLTGSLTNEGLCERTCDPLADNDFDGAGSAFTRTGSGCGAANLGCFGRPSAVKPPTAFTCGFDINAALPLHHRSECTSETGCTIFGAVVDNSCDQGYEPLLRESTAVSTTICVALCAPLDCYAGSCGSNDANRIGAAPHRCSTSDAVGSFGSGEECEYLWHLEVDGSGAWLPSPYSNTVGICVDRDAYGQARCNTLPLAQAAAQGCVSTATAGM